MTKLYIELDDVLDLVNCAEDYGHHNSVLMDAFAEWTGWITDKEIRKFADGIGSQEGYGEEDRDEAIERLTEWRDRYCKPATDQPT